ncbi:LacI family DNA-binding transcriptional regulator [Coriobacterium glomerans]|nr:LacI family DNA-binding transcriptional regulator [Coriobacterium glomerans]
MRIQDIAAEAAVSPSTVSKFINGHYDAMSASTRSRIAEIIERTGYRPSSVARNLRLDRSRMIGVILADIRNPYSSAMLGELADRSAAAGYTLTCAISGNNPSKEAEAVMRLAEAGADGLIVNTCGGNDELLADTCDRAPVVLLDRDVPGASIDLVTSDNGCLVAALLQEVMRDGVDACWLLDEHNDASSVRRERTATFERGLRSACARGGCIALARNACAAAAQLTKMSCSSGGSPIGLIAINGLVFERLVEALAVAGIDVPGAARIATIDEYPWNRVLFGGVTTAAQDIAGLAAAALELLIERIERGRGPCGSRRRIEIPGNIIARRSTRTDSGPTTTTPQPLRAHR